MEPWLLGAGAIVLVGITLWIVWPARAADAVGTPPLREKEAVERSMTDTPRPGSGLPPQGDTFEDQYTSATADLSAGAVAEALESMHQDDAAATPPPVSSEGTVGLPTPPPPAPSFAGAPPPWTPPPFDDHDRSGPEPRKIGLGAAVLLAVLGGLGGAWLYARWQRERNKPINRLRRGARELGSRLGDRIPEVDDLPPAAAPMSGAAAALLLAGLLASRFVRRDSDDAAAQVSDAVDAASGRGRKAAAQAREAAEQGGREFGKRGREAAKQGREAAEQGGQEALKRGRELGKQGRELGKQGRELGKQGREFAEEGGREALKRGRDVLVSGLIREALQRGLEAAESARKETRAGREAAARGAKDVVQQGLDAAESSQPSKLGIGLGSTAAMAAGAYLIWRLTHREPPAEPKPWYAGVQS